ncbi:MAG: hypothetical protein BWX77_00963 [Bacteroidetes bacterium ADurb.Bin090]|nr:MAG: hypothetical protein BWX77_00963 [Bacteroidetes bacterium ADurb.Bin090]
MDHELTPVNPNKTGIAFYTVAQTVDMQPALVHDKIIAHVNAVASGRFNHYFSFLNTNKSIGTKRMFAFTLDG